MNACLCVKNVAVPKGQTMSCSIPSRHEGEFVEFSLGFGVGS